ncbi:MAG: bestrophin family ion channel [Polyangia bacterium]
MNFLSVEKSDRESGRAPDQLPGPPLGEQAGFWRQALTLRGSASLRILPRVLAFGLIAAGVVLLHGAAPRVALEVGPVEIVGGVLALLLVVRTNAGYDRWWEARKLWGGIVNQTRNLVVSALAYGPDAPEWRERLVRWTAVMPHVMRRSLRGERELPEVAKLVGRDAAAAIERAAHMPSYAMRELAGLLRQATEEHDLDRFTFIQLDRERAQLIDHLGGCERILKTPLALVYVLKMRRFVLLYLLALPFALVDRVGWATPLLTVLLAYAVLGIDQIGVELERPFSTRSLSHLPLDTICGDIERQLLALLNEPPLAERSAEVSAPHRTSRSVPALRKAERAAS